MIHFFVRFHAKDCFLEATALTLDPVHQTTSPDKFRSEEAQAEEDRHPTRARRDEHDGAQGKQCETGDDAEGAANLLERGLKHDVGHEPPY